MKRAPGESFEEYRERRRQGNIFTKAIGEGKWFYRGKTPYRKQEVVPRQKRVVITAAMGKRHKGESIKKFRDRRRVCNVRRREREWV